MTNQDVLTVNQLLVLNEMMLGRGVPNQEDGVGYNKADYGACATYWNGLSEAQVADLAKRLVKYSKTQLNIDKDIMKETAEYYKGLAGENMDRSNGVSVNITEDGTLISFRYNEDFIAIIKALPVHLRKYDGENKQWMVSNDKVIPVLNELSIVGADAKNALVYASNHPLLKEVAIIKAEISVKDEGEWTLLKFDYNKDILSRVKDIDRQDRQWNPNFKFWAIKTNHLESLRNTLRDVAEFRVM